MKGRYRCKVVNLRVNESLKTCLLACEHALDTTDLSPAATDSCTSCQPGVVQAAPAGPVGKRVACDRGVLVSAVGFQTRFCVDGRKLAMLF